MRSMQRGFTLLEMMVALMIFSLVSLSGVMLLQATLRTGEQIKIKSANFNALQRAIFLLERDFSHAVARPINAQHDNDLRPEIRYLQQTQENSSVTLLRTGKFNPGGQLSRASLEWVRWRTVDGNLLRASAPFQDETADMQEKRILADVSAFQIRFFAKKVWLNRWLSTTTLPEAIEITLKLRSGTLKHLILLTENE